MRLGPSPAGATRSALRSNSCNAKKSEHIKLVEPPPPESVFDDIEALRKTATLKVSRRVVPVNVAVKRPSNNVFFRCHADPVMALDASVVVGDGGSDDFYFVAPRMLNHATMLPRLRKLTDDRDCLHVARWRDLAVAGASDRGNPDRVLEVRTRGL